MTKHCARRRPHGPHTWVPNPAANTDHHCPGHTHTTSPALAELLYRRPDLGDLTAATTRIQISVAAA